MKWPAGSYRAFWFLPDGIGPLAKAAVEIRQSPPGQAKRIFERFSLHERKVLAHMLSSRSFAQNFPGVPQRVVELHRLGFERVELLDPMVDLTAKTANAELKAQTDRWSMLITLGGVRNMLIEFFSNDYIIDLMERWATNCEDFSATSDHSSSPGLGAVFAGRSDWG